MKKHDKSKVQNNQKMKENKDKRKKRKKFITEKGFHDYSVNTSTHEKEKWTKDDRKGQK